MDLTAGAGECIKVAPDAPDVNDGSLWKRVLRLREEGNLMGAGSPAGSDDNVSAQGIVQGHAYALLAVLEVDGFQLVQLRNPWGDTEWRGAWSDGSREWTPRIMTKVKYVDADDGTFYMEFSDFVHHFEHVYVCRVFDESWLVTTCEAAWAGETAGGCNNTAKIANNPQASRRASPRRRRRSSVESSIIHSGVLTNLSRAWRTAAFSPRPNVHLVHELHSRHHRVTSLAPSSSFAPPSSPSSSSSSSLVVVVVVISSCSSSRGRRASTSSSSKTRRVARARMSSTSASSSSR